MKRHINIPVFIPHYECPNACVFCNQKRITGKRCFCAEDVCAEIDAALATVDPSVTEAEIAFFGGSFTAIPRNEMLELLSISDRYLNDGSVKSVRLSTRPDAIDDEILSILREHGVGTVELGIQSTAPHVLYSCKRGHTAEASERACRLVKKYGFELIGQMMTGLPGSTPEDELKTAADIADFGADGARIYPTVVLPGTALAEMEKCGDYVPLTVEGAAKRCADVLEIFAKRSVKVIRIGLCANEILAEDASPTSYHAAIGELTRSLVYRSRMEAALKSYGNTKGKEACFWVPKGRISQAIGQKRANAEYLSNGYALSRIRVLEDAKLPEFEIRSEIK
ncbi:MAG: radical SAM protein [Clostridia bacterium]|nr:radical SAM protein [Clostridia bacterium]